jgi:hypothetical protein
MSHSAAQLGKEGRNGGGTTAVVHIEVTGDTQSPVLSRSQAQTSLRLTVWESWAKNIAAMWVKTLKVRAFARNTKTFPLPSTLLSLPIFSFLLQRVFNRIVEGLSALCFGELRRDGKFALVLTSDPAELAHADGP